MNQLVRYILSMAIIITVQLLLTLALVSFCVVYGTSLTSLLDEMRDYQALMRATRQVMRDDLDMYNRESPRPQEAVADTHTTKQDNRRDKITAGAVALRGCSAPAIAEYERLY